MALTIKLATCCYCGGKTKFAFVAGRAAPLKCESCGAPLTRLKAIKIEPDTPTSPRKRPPSSARRSHRKKEEKWGRRPRKKQRRSEKKRGWRAVTHMLEEWLDEVEDIFD